MKFAFHGAAHCVTGSKHLLTMPSGKKILFDCGLFQGMGKQTDVLNADLGFAASEVNFMLLSHAHIDHTGLIPKLVKEGFRGNIYCTPATKDLAIILLQDSAEIQRDDTKFINKRRAKEGLPPYQPLYTIDDVKLAIPLFKEVQYGEWFTIEPGFDVLYTDAGHIIGSAAVHLRVTENNKTVQISFSGDVGRYRDIILCSPQTFPQADYIILESTYGNKLHEDAFNTAEQLYDWVKKTCLEKKGKLIIPAFSVGRTQELLYFLNQLSNDKLLNVPVYVDSPLSLEATSVVKNHPENFNKSIQQLMLSDKDPFDFPGLTFIQTVDESKRLNDMPEPCIIISSSGMADAGRIKHHIKNNIGDAKNTILIVGYCEPNSLGGRLSRGEKEVKIFGEFYKVIAETGVMKSMSAHGDYDDLCQFIANQDPQQVRQLFIVHGEPDVQNEFKNRLLKKGFKDVIVPELHEVIGLSAG